MISLKHYIICGILLFQNQTKNWDGTDLPGHSVAKFGVFK